MFLGYLISVDHVPTSDEPSQSVIPQVEAQALSQPELLFIPSPSEICEPVTTVPGISLPLADLYIIVI